MQIVLPEFRQSVKCDIASLLMRVGSSSFSGLHKLKPTFSKLQQLRDSLVQISPHIYDKVELEKLIDKAKEYLTMWNFISEKLNLNTESSLPTWRDTLTGKEMPGSSRTEYLSVLYNLGVLTAHLAVIISKYSIESLKGAGIQFLTAAWIFEKLKDGSKEQQDLGEVNMMMWSTIMKAQAQYCACERVKVLRKNKHKLQARLAIQASKYYEAAYLYADGLEGVVNEKIVGVLRYLTGMFKSRAFYWSAMDQNVKFQQTKKGIGNIINILQKAIECMNSLEVTLQFLDPELIKDHKDFLNQMMGNKNHLSSKNDNLYRESLPVETPAIESLPFGNPITIEADLTKPFEGQELFSQLGSLDITPLLQEYKEFIGELINKISYSVEEVDGTQERTMTRYNLPESINRERSKEIPDHIWHKIEKCKNMGGLAGLMTAIDNIMKVSIANENTLTNLNEQLKREEQEDMMLRNHYAKRWTRVQSNALNEATKKEVNFYFEKHNQAKVSDNNIRSSIEPLKSKFALFDLDKKGLLEQEFGSQAQSSYTINK